MARWVTADEITAARDAFELAIDGWRRPAAHGVGLAANQIGYALRLFVYDSPMTAATPSGGAV